MLVLLFDRLHNLVLVNIGEPPKLGLKGHCRMLQLFIFGSQSRNLLLACSLTHAEQISHTA